MFWRVFLQLVRASRARLALALVAVASGAAVTSALLNLHLDAERKLTQEFRTLGANVVVSPADADSAAAEPVLADAAVLEKISAARTPEVVAAAPYLYVVARATDRPVMVAGTWPDEVQRMSRWWQVDGEWIARDAAARAMVGRNVARQLNLKRGDKFSLRHGPRTLELTVGALVSTGGPEDNQILISLAAAQQFADLPGRIGLVQISVTGSPKRVAAIASALAQSLPGFDARPVRQLAEAEGRLLGSIRFLIFSTVALILTLTALCVLATMAALAVEHRRDVALMKAIGGPMTQVVRLFLIETGLLGFLGGSLGWAAGIPVSWWIGRSVFGASLSVRPEVLPLSVALMTAVALAGALPLRLLGRVRPAVVLRGE